MKNFQICKKCSTRLPCGTELPKGQILYVCGECGSAQVEHTNVPTDNNFDANDNLHKLPAEIRVANPTGYNPGGLHTTLRALKFLSYAEEGAEESIAVAYHLFHHGNDKYQHTSSKISDNEVDTVKFGLAFLFTRHAVVSEYTSTTDGAVKPFDVIPVELDEYGYSQGELGFGYNSMQLVEIRISGGKYNLKELATYDFVGAAEMALYSGFEEDAKAIWQNHQQGFTYLDGCFECGPSEVVEYYGLDNQD